MKMTIKRGASFLLVAVMLISLTACGKGKSETAAPEDSAAAQTEEANTEQQQKPEYEFISPNTISSDFVELTYDEDDGWVLPEYYLYDEATYSNIELVIPFEEGTDIERDEVPEQEGDGVYDQEVNVEISYSIEDVSTFRYYLDTYGYDQHKYADNAYDMTNIGGADCALYEGERWSVPYQTYLGRIENANATVTISITGAEPGDERIDKLLSGLTFKSEDIGNVDPPWPWEGEAFSTADKEATVGKYTLHSKWVSAADSIIISGSYQYNGAAADGDEYLLIDGVLKHYTYDGKSLTYAEDIELGDNYENVLADANGTLWISDYSMPVISVKNGAQKSYDELEGVLAMHPSGKWGIIDCGSEYKRITFDGDTTTEKTVAFDDVDWMSELLIDDNHIYACGDAADGSGHKVFVYNTKGKLQMTLEGEDGAALGSITFVAETNNGFIALDAYNREVILWEKDGTYIGAADHDELFGTNKPWLCGASVLSDDSILIYITDERADGSAEELLTFNLSGF